IARIARHVADVDRVTFAPGRGGEAAVERDDLSRLHLFGAVSDRLLPYQPSPRVIDQKKTEELVVDHFGDATRHGFDQLVQVENGDELDAQLVDQAPEALGRLCGGRRGVVGGEVGEHIKSGSGIYFEALLIASRTSSSAGRKIGITTL